MKIAIIGGSGFIGLNLINKLKENKQIQIVATFNKKKNLKIKKILFGNSSIWKEIRKIFLSICKIQIL